jgi:protein-S-isoprenylcysteine O-methyltransferase Ste14
VWTGLIFLGVYTLITLWWAREYGRPGWRGVTQRRMRYLRLGKAEAAKVNDPQYAEGREAFLKGMLFVGILVAMLAGWVFLAVGFVASLR